MIPITAFIMWILEQKRGQSPFLPRLDYASRLKYLQSEFV